MELRRVVIEDHISGRAIYVNGYTRDSRTDAPDKWKHDKRRHRWAAVTVAEAMHLAERFMLADEIVDETT